MGRSYALFALLVGAAACSGTVEGGMGPGGTPDDPGTVGTPFAGSQAGKGGNTALGGGGGSSGTGGKVTPPGSTPDPIGVVGESAGPLPMRRLTRREYNNSIAALLGDTSNPADMLPADTLNEAGFLDPQDVSTLDARGYFDAADAIASRAVKNLTKILPCDPTKTPEADCARQFVERFGRRAFRRPLAKEEADAIFGLYDATRKAGLDFSFGIRFALQGILQAPEFLYRWEVAPGTKLVTENGLLRLTPHQVASRLSFFLWAGPPDDGLLDAADAGKLATVSDLKAQITRLLADKQAAGAIAEFHRQWIHLQIPGGIDALQKSTKAYPKYDDNVRLGMKAGFDAFVASVFLDANSGHTLKDLLTSPVAFVNEKTAPLFGLTDVKGSDLVRRELDPAQRSGLFTQPAFLAVHATASGSHPTKRGAVVWRDLICGAIGKLPDSVPMVKELPNSTTRERFAEHDKEPCAVCHQFLDPPGFSFENYDGLGQYRTKEGTKDVDASGSFMLPSGKMLSFKNAVELMPQLASADEVQRCVATQWYRYALGRIDQAEDAGSIDLGFKAVKGAGGDLRELLSSIVTSKTFLYRTRDQGEP